MRKRYKGFVAKIEDLADNLPLKMRTKLIAIFLITKVIPLVILVFIAWFQITSLGDSLRETATTDATEALNHSAVDNIERMTTTTAQKAAAFLYGRDTDIRYLAQVAATAGGDPERIRQAYADFARNTTRQLVKVGKWTLAPDGESWVPVDDHDSVAYPAPANADGDTVIPQDQTIGVSTNPQNNDTHNGSTFSPRPADILRYEDVPLYDEVTFIGLDGREQVKVGTTDLPGSRKVNYRDWFQTDELKDVSRQDNTFIHAESYWPALQSLTAEKGRDIYVSDVIGAYVGSNYIGMYTKGNLAKAATTRGYDIDYAPGEQAFAGQENPNGRRFEGIVRWASPVYVNGKKIGYVTLALDHDHIMELVDHQTPMTERYTELPSAYQGNYAFIWDYQSRSIAHPRHNSIVGFDAATGDPQIPWVTTTIFHRLLRKSGLSDEEIAALSAQEKVDALKAHWHELINDPAHGQPVYDLIKEQATFDNQKRTDTSKPDPDHTPAPELTRLGYVGLDGRYLNNAPQCTGWLDLTRRGGSGSLYILWSGVYKLNTAAAIPYYTGRYAPSPANGYSRVGFGFVAIGAGLEDFTEPARAAEENMDRTISQHLARTFFNLSVTTLVLIILVVLIAVWLASHITESIEWLIAGVNRFRSGIRQFRFHSTRKDEFGALADAFDDMADSIVASVNTPLSIIDNDYRIIYMNDSALALCHKTISEVIGIPYRETSIYPLDSEYCPIRALNEGREAEILFHESTQQYFKGTAYYFHDKDNKLIGYIVTTTDETETQNALKVAIQASKAKGDFLSNMSHEIRTPMNAIIGMTAIGKSAPDIERKNYAFTKIESASIHLLGVINDVLDMSKIEANKLVLSPVKFNFEKMLQNTLDVISFRVEEKHQTLSVNIDWNMLQNQEMTGDDQRLAQVIANLLSNAVKFTPENGHITLDVRLLKEEDGICTIQVSVNDTGIGISQEQIPRLFHSFEQAESDTSRKFGGTGLGLAIAKRIVELMNGKIWIDSELGKGSTFTFTAQLRCDRAPDAPHRMLAPGINWKNLRVLAIDDDQSIRDYFRDVAQHLGFTCDVANSGDEAVTLIEKRGVYNIYFVDWRMPGMDGGAFTKWLREQHDEHSVVFIISAAERSAVEENAKAAGADRFLSKPLLPSTVVNSINECLGIQNSLADDARKSQEGQPDDFEKYRILLVEDVSINREIVQSMLAPTKVAIDCAENGSEAVRIAEEGLERYDMIFMDIQMPGMNGLDATKLIRAMDNEKARSIPIIAMTANVFREDIEKYLAVGMNSHVGKPIDFNVVLEKMREYLK